MLRELIKARAEGDQDEVNCILAEARDIKEKKKMERLKNEWLKNSVNNKEQMMHQLVKQEEVSLPGVKSECKSNKALDQPQVRLHNVV